MNLSPGDILDGKYTITRVLGQGGMGVVLEASRPGLTKPVAIKVLLPAYQAKPGIAARFAREARIVDGLRTEHVARVLDVGSAADGSAFLVMEYLEGEDLAKLLAARGSFPVAETADLLLQACEALSEAHTRKIVHRDLKPANLFVTTSVDGMPFVKVLDFGISKSAIDDDVALTRSAAFMGSPLYMSPEQVAAPLHVDARTDVWALGVILYEMVTGVRPFAGETLHALSAAILLGRYAKASTRRSDVPSEIEGLIASALTSRVEDRLPSVEAFARGLAPFGTSAARESYARIERVSRVSPRASMRPGMAHHAVDVAALEETGAGSAHSYVHTESPLARSEESVARTGSVAYVEAQPPAERARSTLRPAVLGLAVVAIAAGAFGFGRLRAAPSAPAVAVSPALEVSAAAVRADASAAAPSVPVIGGAAPAPSALSSSAPSSLPVPALAPARVAAPFPSSARGDECATGATPACEAACAAHAPGRCGELARALMKGTGAPKDVARATRLYEADCDGGAGAACNSLGALYGAGKDAPRDYVKAFARYKQGCDVGSLAACVNLGSMHFDGEGVARNEELGDSYFVKSCPRQGPIEPLACFNLSVAYAQGRGVPKDLATSLSFAKQACDGGAAAGCVQAAKAKLAGEGTPKDVAGALGDLDARCTGKMGPACFQLVTLYMQGLGADVPRDPVRARAYAAEGCDAHDTLSCGAKSALARIDGTATTMSQSDHELETRCNAGVMADCGFLGEHFMSGQGATTDRAKGRVLLDRACNGGVPRSCAKLREAGPE